MRFYKFFGIIIFSLLTFFGSNRVYATDKINLYLFWGEGCPHCKKEKEFLQNLVQNDTGVQLLDFEVYKNPKNQNILQDAAKKLNTVVNGVPFLVIGDKYIVGYANDETTGKEIIRIIEEVRERDCPDILKIDVGPNIEAGLDCDVNVDSAKPSLPKFGNIDLEKLSLPALTIVLGFLDGFNPCAMWVLLFLISLLLGMKDKKRMWILGIAFIVSSASVYFLFMVAWLNLFLFVGYIFWIRAIIAGIALLGGYASLKKFWSKDTSGCDVVGDEKRKSVFDKLGKVTSNKSFLMAIIGIVALAFAVNLVELVCSAGLPAVYTQVLVLNNLGKVQYYLYILLYILFFMLDDLVVFFIAMITLQMTGITTKYVKWSRLIGGILMVAIGIILLFKPEILMFG